MAVKIRASNPADLLAKIKKEINEGKIKTWTYETHNQKQYFFHVTNDNQWKGKAWLLPNFEEELLVFNIIKPQSATVSTVAYAVFHGRFIEMLLAHFDKEFSIAWATAMPASGDVVS
jgi:hypothetical protein